MTTSRCSSASSAQQQANSSAVQVLVRRIEREVEEKGPSNTIHFIVDFLCKHYTEHLRGFASVWNSDPELEKERQEVVLFFKHHKISTQISAHFTNAGYDTLETVATLTTDTLVDIESFNSVKWLPGHKVRRCGVLLFITSDFSSFSFSSVSVWAVATWKGVGEERKRK